MDESSIVTPLIVILGPTASGKTSLAVETAEKYNGEIICADSRTVYKGMDIGTAKPSREERKRVVHWGLDLVEPSERFTAADFKKYALQKISEIRSRGHVPFLVGGTGLYVDSIIFDYKFVSTYDPRLRRKLESYSIEQLWGYCEANNIVVPENNRNARYLIRAIEKNGIDSRDRSKLIDNTVVVGIATEKSDLDENIQKRAEQIFERGVVDEAIMLSKLYGWGSEAMTGNIYPIIHEYLDDEISYEQAVERFVIADRRLAKRQLTWFKRNQQITWLSLTDAREYIAHKLASHFSS